MVALPGANTTLISAAREPTPAGCGLGTWPRWAATPAGSSRGSCSTSLRHTPTATYGSSESRPGPVAPEYPACATHEALINTAFAGRNAMILCPYDAANLDPATLDDARRTHPVITDGSGRSTLTPPQDPIGVAASFNLPLPAPPADAATIGTRAAATWPACRQRPVEPPEPWGPVDMD